MGPPNLTRLVDDDDDHPAGRRADRSRERWDSRPGWDSIAQEAECGRDCSSWELFSLSFVYEVA